MRFIPWIITAALAAACGLLYTTLTARQQEIETWRKKQETADQVRAELERKLETRSESDAAELARLRADAADVLRLRNEIRQIREQQKQLSGDLQTAQASAQAAQVQAQSAQAQAQAIQAQAAALQQRAQAAQPVLAAAQQDPVVATCINNLRQLDGAKQQWALENRRTANDVPTAADVGKYLKNGEIPRCPGGGAYTINATKDVPACSFPGHALAH